jgi:hypothetical protein
MRHGCNLRLRNALYRRSRTSIVCDPKSKNIYAQVQARGPPGPRFRGMADRWLKTLIFVLRHRTFYGVPSRPACRRHLLGPQAGRRVSTRSSLTNGGESTLNTDGFSRARPGGEQER